MHQSMQSAIDQFDLYNEARRRKEITRKSYRYHLKLFGDYIEQQNIQPEAIEEDTILGFLVAEGKRGLSDRTIVDRFVALRTFFHWVERHNSRNRPILGGLKSPISPDMKPHADKKEPKRIALEDYQTLLASINGGTWLDARDRFLIAVLYRCGLRIGETTALRVSGVDMTKKRLKVRAASSKSRKDRFMPFNDEVWLLAMEYLYNRPVWDDDHDVLWLSDDGAGHVRGPMTVYAIRPMLLRRFKKAGLTFVNPHGFRHGFAMLMLNEAGAEMSSVSALLGHASVRTTEDAYAEWLIDPLQREYDAAQKRLAKTGTKDSGK